METDFLKAAGANAALQALAKSYDITPAQLEAIIASVLPAFTNSIERNTLSRGGLSDLVAEIGRPQHALILKDPARAVSPEAQQAGIGALDNLFGNKAKSRSLAAQAASSSGVQQAIIQKLLPILASLVMAALSKQGGLGDIMKRLPDILGGNPAGAPEPAPSRRRQSRSEPEEPAWPQQGPQGSDLGGIGDILSKIPGMPGHQPQTQPKAQSPWGGAGGSTTQLPQPSSETDFGGAGGGFGGSPLPIPGDRIPGINAPGGAPDNNQYGNLPDIIRRGGQSVDGNDLGRAVREKIGTTLGFPSTGIVGWIIRFIVLRWGWGLLRSILSRVLTGR